MSLLPVIGPRRMKTAPDACDAAGRVTGIVIVSMPLGVWL